MNKALITMLHLWWSFIMQIPYTLSHMENTSYTENQNVHNSSVRNLLFLLLLQRSSSKTLTHTVGRTSPLIPYTWYSLRGRVCTQGGCTDSLAILIQTNAARPVGQGPVQVSFANSTTLQLIWNYPREPNGEILK